VASELAEVVVTDAESWRAWLEEHHAESPGVWLAVARKGHTEPTSVAYEEALRDALCYGWIDGMIRRGDGRSYFVRFTPRRPRSAWSAANRTLAGELITAGRMRPAGLAAVQRAKAEGSWGARRHGAHFFFLDSPASWRFLLTVRAATSSSRPL
jgi:uncharacterized protein YdeI (YjbR/CyaY-like superfamily)